MCVVSYIGIYPQLFDLRTACWPWVPFELRDGNPSKGRAVISSTKREKVLASACPCSDGRVLGWAGRMDQLDLELRGSMRVGGSGNPRREATWAAFSERTAKFGW